MVTGTQSGIRLNFQGAQLTDVLNYLSEAAGFIVIQEQPVVGTVNIVSRQPMTPDEAVDLLNTVLLEKNYIALRSGRILKIASRTDAQKLDLPVVTGADPALIPRSDSMVTQILPVHYVDVSKLIANLQPLLSDNATISANDASNAILLTDTQKNVHRIAEIIRALDTSISGISTMHVYPLQYADAKGIADVLTQLFQSSQSQSGNNRQQQAGPGFFGGFGGGGGGRRGGGGDEPAPTDSAARNAASRVIAVADQQSNSVIVSAPEEYMDSISEIVSRLDTNIAAVTETRIFHLMHADATEMTNILSTLYTENTSQNNTNRGAGNNQQRLPLFLGGGQQPQSTQTPVSQRALQESRVVAVADPRTSAVVVTCAHDMMEEIALTIGRLDATDSKKQHIHVYTLENADPDNVASILRGMFTVNGASAPQTSTQATDILTQRTSTGASSDVINTLSTGGNGSSSNGGFR